MAQLTLSSTTVNSFGEHGMGFFFMLKKLTIYHSEKKNFNFDTFKGQSVMLSFLDKNNPTNALLNKEKL